jgi:hypothetical protein
VQSRVSSIYFHFQLSPNFTRKASVCYTVKMVSSSRPRTPTGGKAPAPLATNITPVPNNENLKSPGGTKQEARRSSFGILLRRTKSGEFGSKGSKKHQAHLREMEEQRRLREAANQPAPSLPVLYNGAAPPELQTFGGENAPSPSRHAGRTSMDPSMRSGNIPIPPIPSHFNKKNDGAVDPYARTESMTHRGRYSYASSAVSTINSPRRVRRRKDPTPFK